MYTKRETVDAADSDRQSVQKMNDLTALVACRSVRTEASDKSAVSDIIA